VNVRNAIDTTPPLGFILSPTGGTVSGKFTVSASASDNIAVAKVDLFVDGSLNSSMTRSPYKFSLNAQKWSKGAHTLQIRATDTSANVGWSQTVTVTK